MPTIDELKMRQNLPLNLKIRMTETRIRQWVDAYGTDGVYVSFSGGKDSTVLLDIARRLYPTIPAAFVDTGLEYPEIRAFVKTFDRIDWLKPKKTFKQVIEDYGYPFISKEVSDKVYGARHYLRSLKEGKSNPDYQALVKGNVRLAILKGEHPGRDGKKSSYDMSRYQFFLDAPFEISAKCCNVMKKGPAHAYAKQTGRKPITAQTAAESRLRLTNWLQHGCNGFDMKSPISNPMSFWMEQDVLRYIKERNLPICSVYGDITEGGQRDLFEPDKLILTGVQRTGCMFCGYGCHLEEPEHGRFVLMKETHPKQYDYIMRPREQGGLGYKEVIDWINEHGNFNIAY